MYTSDFTKYICQDMSTLFIYYNFPNKKDELSLVFRIHIHFLSANSLTKVEPSTSTAPTME